MAYRYMKDEDWSKFPNFKKSEFKCKCGGKYCNGYPHEIAYSLVEMLQNLRNKYGKAAKITSGVRCTQHNKNVGGVEGSKHLTGQAADFTFTGINKNEVINWLKTQPNYRYAYSNDKMNKAVHIDTLLTQEPVVDTTDKLEKEIDKLNKEIEKLKLEIIEQDQEIVELNKTLANIENSVVQSFIIEETGDYEITLNKGETLQIISER